MMKNREVEIAALTLDPGTNSPVVILREKGGEEQVPIWIGYVEASAIAMELEKVKVGRPLTHDLLKSVVTTLNATLMQVEVTDLKDNTYFATLRLSREGKELLVDSRPSDAIALAVRFGAPILISERVFQISQQIQLDKDQPALPPGPEEEAARGAAEAAQPSEPAQPSFSDLNRDQWAEILAQLDPSKLSKQ